MVFVKVRETYDLHTVQNKMTVIGIHTPNPDIIKRNYPGLLMQCKAYRPYKCDVRVACASVLPLDPQGVGTSPGDVAPEDIFNPILYKAMSNFGMSQLEARINMYLRQSPTDPEIEGPSALSDIDSFVSGDDDFNIYYGLLADTNNWRHANPQQGLSMSDLRPIVYEINYAIGDTDTPAGMGGSPLQFSAPDADGVVSRGNIQHIIGGSKPLPMMNTTSYTRAYNGTDGVAEPGFKTGFPLQCEQDVPWIKLFVGAIIVPPSRLHQLFYRMVVEWTLEFSSIRSLGEITNFAGLANIGQNTHFKSYDYSATKEALTGDSDTSLDSDSCMVAANVDVEKVM